jgi:hypothetical protein
MSRFVGEQRKFPTPYGKSNDTPLGRTAATMVRVRDNTASSAPLKRLEEDQQLVDSGPPSMAVSIAGISTACSKDALVSSAKAAQEALSTD